jgi:hypothetical protein
MTSRSRSWVIPAVAAKLIAVAGFGADSACAQELKYSLRAGATHSDNVSRTAENERSDTTADIGLNFGFERDGGRLKADLAGDLVYRRYFQDTYDEDLTGGLTAAATYWFVPSRFSWIVQNNFGQTFIDPRDVETPDNRQNTNYFTTGPDLTLPLGSRTSLTIGARWSDASYETSDTDDQRLLGTISLVRRLGARSSVTLGGTTERIEFQNPIFDESYDRHSGHVGFDAQGARTTLSMRAGYTAVHYLGETTDAPLLSLSITRRLTARSSLSLDAGTNLTDSADAFRRDQGIRGIVIGNDDAVVSQDPFRSDYATLGWSLDGVRTSLFLSGDWRRDDHEREDSLNRDSVSGYLRVARRLSARLSADLDGTWRREDYADADVEYDEWAVGLGFDWRLSGSWSMSLRGEHIVGSGDTIFGRGMRDYDENRISLSVTFAPRR